MRLRPYRKNDFEQLKTWIDDKRTHALWCANIIPWPLTEENLYRILEKGEKDYGDCAYTVIEDCGRPIGFFVYNINEADNYGFVKFVILDHKLRGKGYGTEMMKLFLTYAFTVTKVSSVLLNVFTANTGALRCYSKAGFTEHTTSPNAFTFQTEIWDRCLMIAKRNMESSAS